MEESRQALARRIRRVRERIGLTQQELADKAGLGYHQVVSLIEKGEREVKAWELANIARALRVEFSCLLDDAEAVSPEPVIAWRRPPASGRTEIEALFIQACRRYALLEELCDVRPRRSLPARRQDPGSLDYADADDLAVEVSRTLDLGSRPALCVTAALEEDYGVKFWYADLRQQGSAACSLGPSGPAVLVNSSEARWRRNFSIAHELFHLILWNSGAPARSDENPEVEKLANAFASSLLLPSDSVGPAFEARQRKGAVRGSDIVQMARGFDVSSDALVIRLVNLGLLSRKRGDEIRRDAAFREIDRASMSGCWGTQPSTPPERFVQLAYLAYTGGNLSRMTLAEWLGCSLPDLPDMLQRFGFSGDEEQDADTTGGCSANGGTTGQ